jgi:hypothetical protein
VEDTRIDTLVRREYGGIRKAWHCTQENELEKRRLPNEMPPRYARSSKTSSEPRSTARTR